VVVLFAEIILQGIYLFCLSANLYNRHKFW